MPLKSIPQNWDWSRRAEPSELPEWMDEPCSLDELRACLHDLRHVNRLTLGYRPTLSFLDRVLTEKKPTATLRILDVGFGGGDALHRVARWANARSVPVDITGIDLNPNAALVAAANYGDSGIRFLSGDVFEYGEEVDVVISSLLTHHLPTPLAIRFLQWMENTARLGWFVNDLERSAQSARLFAMLSRLMRWHKFVQHDGPVSFARAFAPADWQRMLASSGLASDAAEIVRSFPSRLCVSRLK